MSRGVSLLFEGEQLVPNSPKLQSLADKVFRSEGLSGQLNIIFCSNEKVRSLNKEYRGLDRVTDVLSFSWDEPGFIGEVYIANPQAKYQAPRWNNSYFNELRRLVVHGILHLCGYDHQKFKDRVLMRKKEDFYLELAKKPEKM